MAMAISVLRQLALDSAMQTTVDPQYVHRMKDFIRRCDNVDEFQEGLFEMDDWFMLHDRALYDNRIMDEYWHGDDKYSYCNDMRMHVLEYTTWIFVLTVLDREEWVPVLTV